MWKQTQGGRRRRDYTSWEGMVNLMNTCLVVNTLLLSIDIVTMGFVKNKQDVSSWGKPIVSWYWNTLPISICSHASVSVYATSLLCILSFIDHHDKEKMASFYKWFKHSMNIIGKGTVLNFWVTGITVLASVVFLMDDEFQFDKMRMVFRYSGVVMTGFLLYVLYVIQKLFQKYVDPSEEENSLSATTNEVCDRIEESDLESVLRDMDETFPEKYLIVLEEAFVSLSQLKELDAYQISQYLGIPLGHAMRMSAYFKTK